MTALVIALLVTNAATAFGLALVLRRRFLPGSADGDHRVRRALSASARPSVPGGSDSRTRRIISIEILNPIELAGVRGRVFGIAGSIVPHLTRRIVYDQTVRQLRAELAGRHVVADVRVHVLPPPIAAPMPGEPAPLEGGPARHATAGEESFDETALHEGVYEDPV